MRSIYLWSLSVLLLCCSGVSSASTIEYWTPQGSTAKSSSAYYACRNGWPSTSTSAEWVVYNNATTVPYDGVGNNAGCHRKVTGSYSYMGNVLRTIQTCEFGNTNLSCNASCDAPNTMVDGQCVAPPPDVCADSAGNSTPFFEQFPTYQDYQPNCKVSVNGCQVDVCSGAAAECGTKDTGEFACWGSGTFTGESSEGTENPTSPPDPETPPPPTSTSNSSDCSAPLVNGSTTSYTCVSESDSSQFSNSNCAVGQVNGVTALHCAEPDYVPQSDNKTVTDNVTKTDNPDGSSSTVTDSTTTRTTCKAGVCTTTTTTTTTTTDKDAAGNTTDETTECQGDKCDNPATPEDESEEEEEVERTVAGEDCSGTLACEGDAIDCAVLEQQKLMRCSMDWETQKGSVLAEAAKPEYALQTEEVDMGGLFSGPSASRWLTASCPADRVINLQSTGTSITFSWDFVCQYASGLGNLLVALASLFFAVYVGRAFGGS